jgi:hypothetical protein
MVGMQVQEEEEEVPVEEEDTTTAIEIIADPTTLPVQDRVAEARMEAECHIKSVVPSLIYPRVLL